MADKNKVLVEFQIVQKGKNISVLQKETEKLSKSQDKAANSQKKLSKQQEMGYGRQKQGLVQTANGTKNFSKLAQTINGGGQTSLVGAYATLAANVFAATAAFNALSRAAQFQQLQQGLEIIGNQSGRTLSVLAEGLREATGNALSLEQASSAAALGVSGGFGARELEGLAVIAKGASVALGRDMADAFDRLTRGAIKLEPEILDELGIMVRLDDAVEKYAAQLGKGASALSQLERRQAFVNEILEQGEAKFGDIAEQADPTPYQRLGASFADLTKDFFTFVNETLKLNSAVEFLADNLLALVGVVVGFGSTIATQMIPALGNQAASARAAANAASELAESALEAADAELEAAKSSFLAFKGTAGNFKEAQKQVAASGGSVEAYDKALASLRRSENMRTINLKKQSGEAKIAAEMQIRSIQQQILVTEQLKLAEQNRAAAQISSNLAILESNTATVTANVIEDYTTGQIGLGAAFAANAKNITDHFNQLDELQPVTGNLDKLNRKLTKGFQLMGVQLKTLSAAFLKFLPLLGVALVVAGAVGLAINKIFFTPEIKAYNKQVETLNEILDSVADKAEEYQKAINGTLSPAIAQQREYNILANTISEINENLKETIKLQEEAALTSNSRRVGFGLDIGEAAIISQTIRGGTQSSGMYGEFSIQIKAIEKESESFVRNFKKIFGGIPELVEATFGEVNTVADEVLVRGVTNLAKLKDTPQYESLLETLKLEPYRKFLLNPDNGLDFSVLTKDLTDDDLIKFLKDISTAIDTADKKFGGINDAVNTFSATLKEAEKTGSQFLQKFFPKTAVGDLLDNLVALDKALIEIAESSDGVKEKQQAMGQALSETGPMIRKFFGKEVSDNLTALRVLEGELKKLEESGEAADKVFTGMDMDGMIAVPTFTTKGDIKRAEIAKQVNILGKDGTVITAEAVELARELQTEEILRKATLEGISNIQGVISKVSKESAMGTRINLELEKQRRKVAQDQMDTQLLMQGRAVGAAQEEIKTEEDRLILIAQLEEKLENAKDLGLKDSEIAGIKLSLQQQQNLVFQEQLATATETFKIEQSRLQVQLTRLSSTEKIAQAEAKIAELQAKSAAIRSGRSSEGIIEQIRRQEDTEKKTLENAKERLRLEKAMNAIKASILKAELDVIIARAIENKEYQTAFRGLLSKAEIDRNLTFINGALDKTFEATEEGMGKALENAFASAFSSDKFGIVSGTDNTLLALLQGNDLDSDDKMGKFTTSMQIVQSTMASFAKNLEELFGEDGRFVASVANLGSTLAGVSANIVTSFETINTALEEGEIGNKEAMAMRFAAVGQAVSSVLGALQQMTAADSQRRVAEVEKAIALEKKLDGKSAESVAKINAMEKKKEAIQRKAFETNKKMQMAQAIISSASAAAQTYAALAFNPPLAISMAAIIGALGLAQVAIIRKTKFEGGSSTEAPKNTSLEIGKRSSAVDTAKSATGGELNYLRGGRTDGTNLGGAGASFPGAAMGRKGYADGGVIVGERGPELITPAAPVDVTPNYALGGQPANVNFTINAVDAAGVEDVLMNQRGNLIRMIREAANENGERFLETVDTQSYGSNK